MANNREIKLIEKEFLEFEKNNKNDFLEIKNNKKNLSTTCRQLTDNCRQLSTNVFFKNLKEKVNLNLKEDTNLEIGGYGILDIKIEEDLNLEINFLEENFKNIFIKILVNENKKLNLIDFTNSKNLYKNIEIVLEKNSSLNYSQFILNSKLSISKVFLNENSNYNLKSVYFGDNIKNYILNKAIHIEKNSKSNLEINGLANNNSKIINDAVVEINQKAKKSIGHQRMKNLILDKSSQIQSEPILKVKNNDVICSHASSISQISDEVLFYVNSRGINYNDAIKLISKSYFNIVIENINNYNLKEKYNKIIEKNIFNTI